MPKKTACVSQPTENSHAEEVVDDVLTNVDQFVEGVYRNLNLAPPTFRHFETRPSLSDISPNASPNGTATSSISPSGDERRNRSPYRHLNMDAEIERINYMCDSISQDLRSIGVLLNNSSGDSSSNSSNITIPSPVYSTINMSDLNLDTSPRRITTQSTNSRFRQTLPATIPTQVIDLSETQSSLGLDNINNSNDDDGDDDVVLISADINPVVDLCTPGGGQRETSRRRRFTVDQQTPDVQHVDSCDVNIEGPTTARRRRVQSRKTTSDILQKEVEKSPSAHNTAAGSMHFRCAVCMESYLQRQPTSTKCGHIFCNECLMEAQRLTRKCPLCNTKITKNHVFRIYP